MDIPYFDSTVQGTSYKDITVNGHIRDEISMSVAGIESFMAGVHVDDSQNAVSSSLMAYGWSANMCA